METKEQIKEETKENSTHNYKINNESHNELPTLTINLIESASDFTTRQTIVQASAHKINEAVASMEYLISKLTMIKKGDKK